MILAQNKIFILDSKRRDSFEKLPDLRERYRLGELRSPDDTACVGVDIQEKSIYWVLRGFRRDFSSYLIDAGEENLGRGSGDFELNRVIKLHNWRDVHCGAIDCGYRFEFAKRMARALKWRLIRGEGRSGQWLKSGDGFWRVDINRIKDSLHRLQQDGMWKISHLTPDRYCNQIASERLIDGIWQKERANHWLDCEVYAAVAFLMWVDGN